jgi:helicase
MIDHAAGAPAPCVLPPQAEVLARGLLSSGFSCVLQMPTGSGKTWLAEQAIGEVLRGRRRAIYLTPLRALANELVGRWQGQFAPSPVGVFTGDYGASGRPFPVPFADARLLIMTPERLDACTRAWRSHWRWLPQVDLVVVDEFHLLGDRGRGGRLEGTLLRVQRLNPFARLLCLSATLGNRTELADWLGGTEYASAWRPVPLRWRVVRYRKAIDKPDLLREVLDTNVRSGGKSLVFVQSRRRAEHLAVELCRGGLRTAHHHAGLGHGQRRSVEDCFRAGEVDVLVATGTLEMGLNLPARQVVLYDLQGFDGSDFRPLPTNTVWQRAGRAGRPGLDDCGEVVLLAAAWDRDAARYPQGHFEPVRSGLRERRALAEQIVIEAATGLARTQAQLSRLFQTSLAARQGVLPDVRSLTDEMLKAGMLRRGREDSAAEAQVLRATRLGYVACRHMLTPATVQLLRRLLGEGHDLTFFDLLLTGTATEDCEPVLPVDFEELDELTTRLAEEPSVLLRWPRQTVVDRLGTDGKRLLAALKMALVARDWTRCGSAETVAGGHGCYPFEVERLCECLARLLLAMAALTSDEGDDLRPIPEADEVPLRERVTVLHRMVLHGLDEEAASLTLVEGLGGVMAGRLKAAGITDVEALAQAEAADLDGVRGLSRARALRWIERATELVRTCSAFRYREARPPGPAASAPRSWPPDLDPYRLRRALELRVGAKDGGAYRVVGGLEPHLVQSQGGGLSCDCADARDGNVCKHVLAVRLYQRESDLVRLAWRLEEVGKAGAIDPLVLWFGGSSQDRIRSEQ